MMIAFKCYDMDNDQIINKEEIIHTLRHIPLRVEARYGISFGLFEQEANMSAQQLLEEKYKDWDQIEAIADLINKEYPEGMYFDEYVSFSEKVTSELFYPIFDCLYELVPCVQNYFVLKANFKQVILSKVAGPNISYITPSC